MSQCAWWTGHICTLICAALLWNVQKWPTWNNPKKRETCRRWSELIGLDKATHPLRAGITLPTAFAAPVDAGMMFCAAVRPSRQAWREKHWPAGERHHTQTAPSKARHFFLRCKFYFADFVKRQKMSTFALGPSTVFWVAVYACTVVMRPSSMPKLSLMTLARGARQLVVQDALLKSVKTHLKDLWHARSWTAKIFSLLSRCWNRFPWRHSKTSQKLPLELHKLQSFPFSVANWPWIHA